MNFVASDKVDKHKPQRNLLSAHLHARVPPGKRYRLDNLQLPQRTAGLRARVPPILKVMECNNNNNNNKLLELHLATRTLSECRCLDWRMGWFPDILLDNHR